MTDTHIHTAHPLVTRIEVIIGSEQRLIANGASKVETHIQDHGRALKILLREPDQLYIPAGWRDKCPDQYRQESDKDSGETDD